MVDVLMAEEEEESDANTKRPLRWKCTSQCKLPTSKEALCIIATKQLFDKPVQKLKEGLNKINVMSVGITPAL